MNLNCNPYYETKFGATYLGNSLELMAGIPDESIDLICTSPPFALIRKKNTEMLMLMNMLNGLKIMRYIFTVFLNQQAHWLLILVAAGLRGCQFVLFIILNWLLLCAKQKKEADLGFIWHKNYIGIIQQNYPLLPNG